MLKNLFGNRRKEVEMQSSNELHPRVSSQLTDVRRDFPTFIPSIIFDVGANIGQTTDEYLSFFTESHVFCFEPSGSTFELLQEHFSGSSRVHCFNFALSNVTGSAQLEYTDSSLLRRLVSGVHDDFFTGKTEKVALTTLDEFCAGHHIQTVDFLKIDTEGHEISVLEGGERLLESGGIQIIELELGMNPENLRHARFEDAKELLEQKGYRLFRIYEQTEEWPTKQPHLRRVNAIFLSNAMIAL